MGRRIELESEKGYSEMHFGKMGLGFGWAG